MFYGGCGAARLMCCNGIVMTSAQLTALCTLKDKPFARHVVKVKHKAKFEERIVPLIKHMKSHELRISYDQGNIHSALCGVASVAGTRNNQMR